MKTIRRYRHIITQSRKEKLGMGKKIYGIDLGTTNSAVSYAGEMLTGLVASVADVRARVAGNELRRDFASQISRAFKTSISLGDEGIEPVEASALVLKSLVEEVKKNTGETMRDVVISVPAAFNSNERTATIKAATKIGLNVVDLVSEPTAAALKFNKDKKALTVIYDLGGGTFDISVIDNRTGVYAVRGTDGTKLGGVDLDNEIQKLVRIKSGMVKHRIKVSDIPLITGMCEDAKIRMQKEMEDIVIDMSHFEYCGSAPQVTLTVHEYMQLVGLVFKETIDMTKNVIASSICDGEDYKMVMVGGSTHDPFLRKLVEVELEHDIEPVDYDPDTIVAEGAGYYALLKEQGVISELLQEITKGFGIELENGAIKQIIAPDSKVPVRGVTRIVNASNAEGLSLRVYQGNHLLASQNQYVGTMDFTYREPQVAGEGEVYLEMSVDTNGVLELSAREALEEEQKVTLRFLQC